MALLLVSQASLFAAAPERPHPFLFVTAADVARAREGAKQSPAFAVLAEELVQRATTNSVKSLPPLETNWWRTAKQKHWRDTYPEVFHHTWMVPYKWADLARDCARANLLKPSPALTAKGREVLLRLSDYTFEYEHFDVGMNYTVWNVAALDAYDILYPGFSAPERARLDAFFERYLAALRKNDDYWIEHEPGGRLNNHYAWHKLGLGMIGAFYGRPELIERAVRGPKGVEAMLAEGFRDDGLWLEGSIPYQFAETAPLVLLAQALANGKSRDDLFRYRSANGYSLKRAYDAVIPLLFPDRTLPTIGDCYARRVHLGENPDWEILFRHFHEPAYAWLIADRPTRTPQALFNGAVDLPPVTPPAQASKLWPQMGYIALRSNEGTNYWSGNGWSVFATFSGQGVHEHADKLSVMLFANGHLWLPDLEAKPSAEHAFSSETQGQLNRQTLCHNTLLVDGRSQRFMGQRLDLLEWTNAPGLKRASFGDLQGRLYEGVRQLRTLIVAEDYVLDLFQADSATPHEFAWLTHVDGQPAAGSVQATNALALPGTAPWSYLRNARSALFGARAWETFAHDAHTLRLDLLTDGPSEVVQCAFPRDDSPTPVTVPMRLIKRQGSTVWFAAAYRIDTSQEPAEMGLTAAEGDKATLTLRLGSQTYQHTVPRLRQGVDLIR